MLPVAIGENDRIVVAMKDRMNGTTPRGFNVAGYIRHELGLGEAARLFIAVAEAAGYDYAATAFLESVNRQQGAHAAEGRPSIYDTNVLYINPNELSPFLDRAAPEFPKDRYTIGAWAWETEDCPEDFWRAEIHVDEIWMPSRFAAESVARSVTKPVRVFPHPIVPPKPSRALKSELGLPEGFVFLFCFDFCSVAERKNPHGLMSAFERAFWPGEGPQLFIKSINGQHQPEKFQDFRRRAAGRPDIHVRDFYLNADDLAALMASSDAYVSLHRSEGFGLTLGEMMALGKPTIGTGYSGNLEFMDSGNSWLVPYKKTLVPAGCGPYSEGFVWAEPDIDAAARALREVYDNREEARRRGARAKQDVLQRHSLAARARLLRRFMTAIKYRRLVRGSRRRPAAAAIDNPLLGK